MTAKLRSFQLAVFGGKKGPHMAAQDTPSTSLPVRRRTFEDKTVRMLADHAGKIYLGLFVLAALVVTLHEPLG
ncbi:MAG: hypothetical protein EBQ88_06645 [Betaproteobacteria bacterium]|nr:hypothetical protein [Betaproteobacteria bacterium]